jgi:hypothetical protein
MDSMVSIREVPGKKADETRCGDPVGGQGTGGLLTATPSSFPVEAPMTRSPAVLAVLATIVLLTAGTALALSDDPAAGDGAVAPAPAGQERADASHPSDGRPGGSLPRTGGGATSVAIGAMLLVAAVVHWRLTAPGPPED